jgi:hypothetical protein
MKQAAAVRSGERKRDDDQESGDESRGREIRPVQAEDSGNAICAA